MAGIQDLPVPGSDAPPGKVFDCAFLHDQTTINYLNSHGHVMFIIRGPPGTAKEALGDMISSKYPSCKLLSAKNYFKQPLAASRENSGAKLSHNWCYKKTVEACIAGVKVVVVRNTNVRKCEIERYLNLSQDYRYTLIIADASKKFYFDAKILAKSNAQGLSPVYFESRLKQWDEIVPWYTGWFLNPADSHWLENDIGKHLSALLEFPEFRRDFSYHSNAEIDNYYKNERELFCIAGFCSCCKSGEQHYLDKKVQNELGKVSDLLLTGYLVTSEMVLAVVKLSSEQGEIARKGKPEKSGTNEDFAKMFQSLTVKSRREPQKTGASSIPSEETIRLDDQGFSSLHTRNLSYIVMKHSSTVAFPYITDVDTYTEEIFSRIKRETPVSLDEFSFSSSDIKACQLEQMVWIVCPVKTYIVQSVFTGLYS